MKVWTPYEILGIIALLPILYVIYVYLEFYFKKFLRARRDYKIARGTIHKDLLKKCLKNLKKRIETVKIELDSVILDEKNLRSDKNVELKKAATTYIFEADFTSILGIGKVLKDRVQRSCFDGTTESLKRAWGVHGIGETKAYAIQRWIDQTNRRLPQVLNEDFPNKKQIVRKYNELIDQVNQKIKHIDSTYQPMLELDSITQQKYEELRKVTSSTFRKSYNGDDTASQMVTDYHLGCFPEWKKSPPWFNTLMEAYS